MICGFWVLTVAALVVGGCVREPEEPQINLTQAYVDARSVLLRGVDDPDLRVRMHALEALASTEGLAAGPALMQGLNDDPAMVVAAAAMAAGDIRYGPAKPRLMELAAHRKTPPKLLCVVIYALHRLGNDEYTSELGKLLRHDNKWVRAEAARVMGMMGEKSAVGPLKNLLDDEREVAVRLQIAEALALVEEDERSIGMLEGFTKGMFVEDKIIAIRAMGRFRHRRTLGVLENLMNDSKQDTIIRVAAVGSLARMGDSRGYKMARQAILEPERMLKKARKGQPIRPEDIEIVRIQGVMALEHMGETAAVDDLHPLLRARSGELRVAAAKAVLRLLKEHRPPGSPQAPEEQPDSQPVAKPPLHVSGGKD